MLGEGAGVRPSSQRNRAPFWLVNKGTRRRQMEYTKGRFPSEGDHSREIEAAHLANPEGRGPHSGPRAAQQSSRRSPRSARGGHPEWRKEAQASGTLSQAVAKAALERLERRARPGAPSREVCAQTGRTHG